MPRQPVDALSDCFRAFFASYPEAVLLVDPAGLVAVANAAACTLLRHPPAALEGTPVATLLHLDLQPGHAALLQRQLASGDGTPLTLQVRAEAVQGDGAAGWWRIGLAHAGTASGSPALSALVDALPDAAVLQDVEGTVLAANAAARTLLGLGATATRLAWCGFDPVDESGAALPWDLLPPVTVLRQGAGVPTRVVGLRPADGACRWVRMSAALVPGAVAAQVLVTLADMDAQVARERALRERGEWLVAAAEASLDSVYVMRALRDARGLVTDFQPIFVNRNAANRLGISQSELLETTLVRFADANPAFAALLPRCLQVMESGVPQVIESGGISPGTTNRWMSRTISRVGDNGVMVTSRDITDRRRYEEALRKLVHVDTLTGLPNRRMFLDLLEKSCQRMRRRGNGVALLFVDLDDLKVVNDRHGHAAGDEMLRAFARALQASVRATDCVARLAGDEFTVLLEDLPGPAEAQAVVEKLLEALQEPVQVCGHAMCLSASVGMAFRTALEADPEELLAAADEAMYRVKRGRRAGRTPASA